MKKTLKLFGILLTLSGIVWTLQGAGIFPYPANSFMVNQSKWITYGIITTFVGMVLFYIANRGGKNGPSSEN